MIRRLRGFQVASGSRKVEERILFQNIQEAGLSVRTKIPLDGNCLFHALCDQLKLHGIGRFRHMQLRKMIVDHMKKNPYIVSE